MGVPIRYQRRQVPIPEFLDSIRRLAWNGRLVLREFDPNHPSKNGSHNKTLMMVARDIRLVPTGDWKSDCDKAWPADTETALRVCLATMGFRPQRNPTVGRDIDTADPDGSAYGYGLSE